MFPHLPNPRRSPADIGVNVKTVKAYPHTHNYFCSLTFVNTITDLFVVWIERQKYSADKKKQNIQSKNAVYSFKTQCLKNTLFAV